MTDIEKVNLLLRENLSINPYAVKRNEEIVEYLLSKYPGFSIKEICWRVRFGISETPKCQVCGKDCRFEGNLSHIKTTNNGYFWHCSNRCAQLDKNIQNQIKSTKLERYGSEAYNNSEKIKSTYLKNNNGIGFSSKSATEKMRKTTEERYGKSTYNNVDKMKNTKQIRYGNKNYVNHEKYVQTCLERYGVINWWCTKESRDKCRSEETKIKVWETKKNNGSLLRSSYEDIVLKIIREFYDKEISCNNRSVLSGLELDLYLPDIKLGIEVNGTFFHADPRVYNALDIISLPKRKVYATKIWEKDYKKIKFAETKNIKVITVWTDDLDTDLENVKTELYKTISSYLKLQTP